MDERKKTGSIEVGGKKYEITSVLLEKVLIVTAQEQSNIFEHEFQEEELKSIMKETDRQTFFQILQSATGEREANRYVTLNTAFDESHSALSLEILYRKPFVKTELYEMSLFARPLSTSEVLKIATLPNTEIAELKTKNTVLETTLKHVLEKLEALEKRIQSNSVDTLSANKVIELERQLQEQKNTSDKLAKEQQAAFKQLEQQLQQVQGKQKYMLDHGERLNKIDLLLGDPKSKSDYFVRLSGGNGTNNAYWSWNTTSINKGGFTVSTSNQANDTVTIPKPGIYFVSVRTASIAYSGNYCLQLQKANNGNAVIAQVWGGHASALQNSYVISELFNFNQGDQLRLYQSCNHTCINGDPNNVLCIYRISD